MKQGKAIFQTIEKKIFILHPVSSDLAYKEEILGMQPMVICEDLSPHRLGEAREKNTRPVV